MKKYIYKSILFLLVLSVLASSVVFGAESVQNSTADNGNITRLFKYDGDTPGDSVLANKSKVDYRYEDDVHKNVMVLTADTGNSEMYVNCDSVKSGVVLISFDLWQNRNNARSLLTVFNEPLTLMNNQNNMFETLFVRENGEMQWLKDMKGFSVTPVLQLYEGETWYHFDIYLDMDNRKLYYFIDGKEMGSLDLNASFDKFAGLCFRAYVMNGETVTLLDNFYIDHITKNGYALGDYVQGCPQYINRAIVSQLTTEETGNIFYSKDITINMELENMFPQSKRLKTGLIVTDEQGREITTLEKECGIEPLGKNVQAFKFRVERFGFYFVSGFVEDTDTKERYELTTRFSVAKGRTDGKVNNHFGINEHLPTNKMTDEQVSDMMELLKKGGIGAIRDPMTWNLIEKTPGVFKLDSAHDIMADFVAENDMNYCLILLPNNNKMYYEGNWPRDEAGMKVCENYIRETVRATKDRVNIYEVTNEPNINDVWPIERYVEFCKMAYRIVKEESPEAKVYAFSLANRTWKNFLDKGLELGIADYCDGISIHLYEAAYSPDSGQFMNTLNEFKEAVRKHNVDENKLLITETGYPTVPEYVTNFEQAQYLPRLAAVSSGTSGGIYVYVYQEKIKDTRLSETGFGIIRGWKHDERVKVEILNEAKPAWLSVSCYNALVADATYEGFVKIADDNVCIYRYRDSNGENIYMLWSTVGQNDVALKLGTDSVIKYDMYGNETVISADNGLINLTTNGSPIYIRGNFTEFEVAQNSFYVYEDNLEVVKGDKGTLHIVNNTGRENCEITVSTSQNLTTTYITDFTDNIAEIGFDIGENEDRISEVIITVKDKTDGRVLYEKYLDVVYTEEVTTSFDVEYYKDNRWQAVLSIKNNNFTRTVSGSYEIEYPEEMKGIKATFEDIKPRTTRSIRLNIPQSLNNGEATIGGKVNIKDRTEITFDETSYFANFMKVPGTPVIDGVIDPGEYNITAPMKFNKEYQVREITNWGGVNDLSGYGYLNYDEDYFYLAAVVTDNILGDSNAEREDVVWSCDSIQFAFANERLDSAKRTEIGIGLVKGEPKIERYFFINEVQKGLYLDNITKEGFEEDTILDIKRVGNTTVYEARIAWDDIYGLMGKFDRKNVFFSMLVNDNDGSGRRGWLEFAPGIGVKKSAALFANVVCQ